jgi:putative CocE/NonD family hydrolase
VRGTGSSPGDALDEYQEAEQTDLPDAFAWLAAQDWCDGQIGMWGTSYSGFNSLQIACEQPPELKAICAIFATDDRWTDDVHWRGGALKLVDLVDYNHYMSAMCVLPPVPAVWEGADGTSWYDEWLRRLDTNEPWVLTWLRANRHGPYWDHGSVRLGGTTSGYERVTVPTMIVAGWADGYRNNSYRTVAELARHGTPHRLLAGPWAHADPTTAMPGPRIDFDAELAGWFDHWLRGTGSHEDRCDVFVRASTRPEIDLDLHEGRWLTLPSVPPVTEATLDLTAPVTLRVIPDVGTRRLSRSSCAMSSPTAPPPWSAAAPSISPTATGSTANPHRWCPAARCRSRSCSTRAPTSGPRATRCGSRWRGPTGPTRSRRRLPWR